jgi:hypothetical protein
MTGSLYFLPEFAGIKDDFLSECFRTGAGISCFLGISVLLWVMAYGLWVYYRY